MTNSTDEELKACPFCGGEAKAHGSAVVACENINCEALIDFGHWCGTENGIPAIDWVIKAWNTRPDEWVSLQAENEELRAQIYRMQIHGYDLVHPTPKERSE